jgi:hypothetical protein
MSDIELQIREALANYLKDPSRLGLTTELAVLARALNALPVYADISGALLIRPNGEVLSVLSDQAWSDTAKFNLETDPVWIQRAYERCSARLPALRATMAELAARLRTG